MDEPLTCIDLFAGCGGFSLGLHRAGLQIVAAIDFEPKAMEVYRANFPDTPHVLCEDLTQFAPAQLAQLIGTHRVDVIAGGPPCQGFSQVRQRDGANHGQRMIHDPRRTLYQQYFEYVSHFQPRLFVMENVLGIRSAAGGKYFTAVHATARDCGYRVTGIVIEAWKYGVPQKRRRQLIVGTRLDIPDYFRDTLIVPTLSRSDFTLGDAIGDLPRIQAGHGTDPCEYDHTLRQRQLQKSTAAVYLRNVLEINKSPVLTAHVARPHSERDLRDFKKLNEGETAKQALARGEQLEFPYNRECFDDRYTRQSRSGLCSTIVAHLSKDGLMFIHPTQNRSLTPREAARVQSFPDWFQFPIARTHQFRVIGNAVPPLISEAVGRAVVTFLRGSAMNQHQVEFLLSPLPESDEMALEWLMPLFDLDQKALRKVPLGEFKKAWYAISFLYAGLHPDEATDHGSQVITERSEGDNPHAVDSRLESPYYANSGWPVVLGPIAKEAWRRYKLGEFEDAEFYCSEAAVAGMSHRNPELSANVGAERRRLKTDLTKA